MLVGRELRWNRPKGVVWESEIDLITGVSIWSLADWRERET
jgi:hypothetical protein